MVVPLDVFVGRHTFNFLGSCWIFILTFVDDIHLASGAYLNGGRPG